jgi:hypothetical protein
MKKTIRIKESQLNDVIKKVIKEQAGQVMTSGPSPDQISGSPESENPSSEAEGPNFDEFKECAKKLLDQGVTIGNLVDQLIELHMAEPETEKEPDPDAGGGVEPEAPMNESKRRK